MTNISFDEFKKMDIKVGEIKSAEEIEGADKLYKINVDIGEMRELVAGIKQHYPAEALIGKKVVVLTNLEPRTIRGVESKGMILAASSDDKAKLTVLTIDSDIQNGSKIS